MRKLVWSRPFIRALRRTAKKHPRQRASIEETLKLLVEDPFAPRLASHKLKGKLSGSWACSAGYDLRVIFEFVPSERGDEDDLFLIEIGTHEEVY